MKRTLLPAALALVLAGSVAFAQEPQTAPAPDTQQPAAAPAHPHHAPNPQRETKRLTRELTLTTDQQAKVEPILVDRDQKITALQANTALTPKELHKQTKMLHKAAEIQLQAVLTPDQMEKLMAMDREHRRHGKDKGDSPEQPAATPPTA